MKFHLKSKTINTDYSDFHAKFLLLMEQRQGNAKVVFIVLMLSGKDISACSLLIATTQKLSETTMTMILFATKHIPLRKHAYSNVLKILPPKMKNFREKI